MKILKKARQDRFFRKNLIRKLGGLISGKVPLSGFVAVFITQADMEETKLYGDFTGHMIFMPKVKSMSEKKQPFKVHVSLEGAEYEVSVDPSTHIGKIETEFLRYYFNDVFGWET